MSEPAGANVLRLKFALILPHLDERQRRLYLGAEARVLGHGGTEAVARAAGVSRRLVRVGRQEVEMPPDPRHRVRRPGGGRKPTAETDVTLVDDLESLISPTEPAVEWTPLRWTCRSSPNLSAALGAMGHRISPTGVQRLLRSLGYRVEVRVPAREGRPHPEPDGQFRYVSDLVRDHVAEGQAVLSLDVRKWRLVADSGDDGHAKLPGCPSSFDREPHDAAGSSDVEDDLEEDERPAWLREAEDEDTGAFAADVVRHWLLVEGGGAPTGAMRVLICVNTGGRAGFRHTSWRDGLTGLARDLGVRLTVCHLPSGVRRWTTRGGRMNAHLCVRWPGRPPARHQLILDRIGPPAPGSPLHPERDLGKHVVTSIPANGRSDSEVDIRRHEYHGDWNFTVAPRSMK